MFVAYMVVLTSGMFRLAELQILRSLLRLSRVTVGDRVYVQPYEKESGQYFRLGNKNIQFNVRNPAVDILRGFPKTSNPAAKQEDLMGLSIEYRDYYMNWIGRIQ